MLIKITGGVVSINDIGQIANAVAKIGFNKFPGNAPEKSEGENIETDISDAQAVVRDRVREKQGKSQEKRYLQSFRLNCLVYRLQRFVRFKVVL